MTSRLGIVVKACPMYHLDCGGKTQGQMLTFKTPQIETFHTVWKDATKVSGKAEIQVKGFLGGFMCKNWLCSALKCKFEIVSNYTWSLTNGLEIITMYYYYYYY